MSRAEYAEHIGIKYNTLCGYLRRGIISQSSLVKHGKRQRIDVAKADNDIQLNLNAHVVSQQPNLVVDDKTSTMSIEDHDLHAHNDDLVRQTVDNSISKDDADRLKAIAAARIQAIKAKILAKEYISREIVAEMFASRAAILKSDLTNFLAARTPEIISICGGDDRLSPDLQEYLLDNLEVFLGRYSKEHDFEDANVEQRIRTEY